MVWSLSDKCRRLRSLSLRTEKITEAYLPLPYEWLQACSKLIAVNAGTWKSLEMEWNLERENPLFSAVCCCGLESLKWPHAELDEITMYREMGRKQLQLS